MQKRTALGMSLNSVPEFAQFMNHKKGQQGQSSCQPTFLAAQVVQETWPFSILFLPTEQKKMLHAFAMLGGPVMCPNQIEL